MQRGLKYLKLFENQNQSLASRFLDTFPDRLINVYPSEPNLIAAIWNNMVRDKGQFGELMNLGLLDLNRLSSSQIRRLPGIDRIVCIYGPIEETQDKVDLLNQMCDSFVVGLPLTDYYQMYLDEDHLIDKVEVETVQTQRAGKQHLIRCKTLSDVPLLIVERMSWTIFLNVDDLDKMKPWS